MLSYIFTKLKTHIIQYQFSHVGLGWGGECILRNHILTTTEAYFQLQLFAFLSLITFFWNYLKFLSSHYNILFLY